MPSLSDLRQEYSLKSLTKKDVNPDPFMQFGNWFEETVLSAPEMPNAVILSTVGQKGRPSSRVVLLKGFSEEGFIFFTNYLSRKGLELEKNPFASLLFFWPELERQIRIEGRVEKISPELSSEYFASRPRLSQIGALASHQSEIAKNRSVLEEKFQSLEKDLEGKEVPRPEHWGGYNLIPDYFEFWQGRRSRLHDRISYWLEQSEWKIKRLSP